jgi:hypothetical protein
MDWIRVSFVVFRRRFVAANLRVFFALPIVVRPGEELLAAAVKIFWISRFTALVTLGW